MVSAFGIEHDVEKGLPSALKGPAKTAQMLGSRRKAQLMFRQGMPKSDYAKLRIDAWRAGQRGNANAASRKLKAVRMEQKA